MKCSFTYRERQIMSKYEKDFFIGDYSVKLG